jgi:hypothetical protein
MIKMIFFLCGLIPGLTQTTVGLEEVSKHVGKIIKINCQHYQTTDNGRTVTFRLHGKRSTNLVLISLTGKSRQSILTQIQIRRDLNRQIKSALDTSLTAAGKIIFANGHLTMLVSRPADIYLGADLQPEQP